MEFDGQRLTYAELDRLSNQLAHYLNKNGVRPDTCLGISLQRSLDMAVGVLAILKTGAAYVPLDPQYPQSRLSYMLENSAVELLLTQKQFLSSFSGLAKSIVCLDACRLDVSQQSQENSRARRCCEPCLCDLYVRLDRQTQRRSHDPWGARQSAELADIARGAAEGPPDIAVYFVEL